MTRPVPTKLKIVRGNPGKRPLPTDEPEPEIAPQIPEPPHFLTGYARDEWYYVSPELYRLGLLTIVDTASLAAYCQAYGRWRTAEEAIARMAANDPVMAGLIIRSKNGEAVQNPLCHLARKASLDMVAYAGQFGLTPLARLRLATGPEGPEGGTSKFAGLLAG